MSITNYKKQTIQIWSSRKEKNKAKKIKVSKKQSKGLINSISKSKIWMATQLIIISFSSQRQDWNWSLFKNAINHSGVEKTLIDWWHVLTLTRNSDERKHFRIDQFSGASFLYMLLFDYNDIIWPTSPRYN